MKIKKRFGGNEGFSLIEMIVSILITAIIMLGVGVFISTSRYTYTTVSVSSKLQEEATSATNYIQELMRESMGFGYQEIVSDGKQFKVIWIKTPIIEDSDDDLGTNSQPVYNFISFIDEAGEGEGKLYYSKTKTSESMTISESHVGNYDVLDIPAGLVTKYIKADKYSLLAENVKSVYLNPYENNRMIRVKLDFRFFDQDYSSNTAVLSRNLT